MGFFNPAIQWMPSHCRYSWPKIKFSFAQPSPNAFDVDQSFQDLFRRGRLEQFEAAVA
jgi:hypothetical protein